MRLRIPHTFIFALLASTLMFSQQAPPAQSAPKAKPAVEAPAAQSPAKDRRPSPGEAAKPRAPRGPATVAEAQQFASETQKKLLDLTIRAERNSWVQANFITFDTEILSADAQKDYLAAAAEAALGAARFDKLKLPPDVARKMMLLKTQIVLPTPADAALRAELAETVVSMESDYGRGKYCPAAGSPAAALAAKSEDKCLDVNAITRIFAESRDPNLLRDVWLGWHKISPPMRQRYARFVQLSNQGAKELNFADTGALWRAKYDMPPDAFSAEVERLWNQVKPLYNALHAHVRARLREKYGDAVPADGPIPAHLLGNIWSQDWSNIYSLVAPQESDPGFDVTQILKQKNVSELEMVRYGERFFSSLGFAPLPKTFWERSLFTKPRDRDVVCHASAWDINQVEDLRIKMCIEQNEEDFSTIHHELGHNYYQRAYNKLDPLFRNSANDGFHEATGDTIALSITPEYLKEIGFIQTVPPASGDVGLLMRRALEKVAFLPFGLLIDQWRWQVFSGKIAPADYNKSWWELRTKYQGISRPEAVTEQQFDPGAKYHVPANVPYTRYFLAAIYQFQFHRALCREAGYKGPLHRCSIYNSKQAGEKLNAMLAMGASQPWQEALFAMTGEKQADASAMLDYFAPLMQWLEEQNKGRAVGWAAK